MLKEIAARDQLHDQVFDDREQQLIRDAIKVKYRKVSQSAEGHFRYKTGKAGAVALGYDAAILDMIPEEASTSFCGVGNPFSVGPIAAGSRVLDVGCGAGFDLLVAGRYVGPEGHVCGIDLTEEMVSRAQTLIGDFGDKTMSVRHVTTDAIPYDNDSFDYVISNGVFNLSPCKLQLFREVRRVLKPGGKLHFADIVLVRELPEGVAGSIDDWSQ